MATRDDKQRAEEGIIIIAYVDYTVNQQSVAFILWLPPQVDERISIRPILQYEGILSTYIAKNNGSGRQIVLVDAFFCVCAVHREWFLLPLNSKNPRNGKRVSVPHPEPLPQVICPPVNWDGCNSPRFLARCTRYLSGVSIRGTLAKRSAPHGMC